MPVSDTHKDYDEFVVKWKRVRDVVIGQDAVHGAGEIYLPRLRLQTDEDYEAYVARAVFYNATWRTIAGLVGMLFRKNPILKVPIAIEPMLDDIGMKGMTFNQFAKIFTYETLGVGRVGILIDYPKMPQIEPLTTAVAEELGLRPVMQMYETESIVNWKERRVGNKVVLSLVVLAETFEKIVDEFTSENETQYRVLDLDEKDLYRVRIFQKDKGDQFVVKETIFPMMGNSRMTFIPFYVEPIEEPPLIDLVNVNVAHYRVSADYEHGCHFTGLPTAVVSGYNVAVNDQGVATEKLYIGSQTAWVFPNENTKVMFLEFTGQGLGALEKNLERKEQQMAVLGARMLADEKKQVETFGATAIKRTGENSILADISISVSLLLKKALEVFSQWAGAEGEIEYEINRKFLPVPMDAATLTSLVAAWQSGALSENEFFDLLKRGDMVESDKTLEEHQAEIDAAPPAQPEPELEPEE